MPLFRGHVIRSTIIAGLLIFAAHRAIKQMPESMRAFTLTQASIAIIALSCIMLLVVAHHRREGEILTRTQEEMLLISAFALFWLSAFVAYRAFGQREVEHNVHVAVDDEIHVHGGSGALRTRMQRPTPSAADPSWPCSGDAFRCVVEEWTYL